MPAWCGSWIAPPPGPRPCNEHRNEEVFDIRAEARVVIARWRQDYNQVRPHTAHGGLTPETVARRSAGDRPSNPDQLCRSLATTEPAEAP